MLCLVLNVDCWTKEVSQWWTQIDTRCYHIWCLWPPKFWIWESTMTKNWTLGIKKIQKGVLWMFEVSNGALQLFARGYESNTEIFMHSKWARDSRRSGPMLPATRRGPRWRWLRLEKGQMLRESWRTEIIERGGKVWRERCRRLICSRCRRFVCSCGLSSYWFFIFFKILELPKCKDSMVP